MAVAVKNQIGKELTTLRKKLSQFLQSERGVGISKNLTAILFGVFAFQISMFITGILFKKSVLLIHVLAMLALVFAYILFKDKAEDSAKTLEITLIKSGTVVFVAAAVNHLFLSGLARINDITVRAGMSKIMLFIDLAILVSMFALMRKENVEEFVEKVKESSTLEWLLGGIEEVKPGDVLLGTDVDRKVPVRLPLKDRYLHMLILGPTGSGKTSQTIIPMIYQDIQNPELGITVIEPKSDLAEKVYAMAKYYGREVEYFNPTLRDCPYFNPLYGDETDAIENIATTFKMLNPDSPQFFQDMNENLIRNSMKVIKRLYGNDATLLHLETLIHNTGGEGEKMVKEFMKLPAVSESMVKENRDIAVWFLQDYFTGAKGSKTATKTYEHCSGVRSQVMKLVSNKYLRKVLNPPAGHGSDIDFDKALAEGKIITITTAQGKLRDLGRFLGYFIILQLQSSVFRRPGNEDTRRGNMLYIDEFQVYANPGFEDMLTQGRSYRVASHLATQTRALIGRGGQSGKDFLEVVSTNARNIVIYPGGSADDAKYYEEQFGEEEEVTVQKGISRMKLTAFSMFAPFHPPNESIRETPEMKARYTATDIMYQPFGRIFYRLIKNNSVQAPGISQINFIPSELNDTLDRMVAEYNEQQIILHSDNLTLSSTQPDKVTYQEKDPVDVGEGFVDPLALLNEKQVPSETVVSDSEDDYIFIDEKDNNKAKTQSNVIDLEDDDVFEF